MQIVLNGQMRIVEPPCSVAELLRHIKLERATCAVEVNRELVPKLRHGDRQLVDGDSVEIVTLVGGG